MLHPVVVELKLVVIKNMNYFKIIFGHLLFSIVQHFPLMLVDDRNLKEISISSSKIESSVPKYNIYTLYIEYKIGMCIIIYTSSHEYQVLKIKF